MYRLIARPTFQGQKKTILKNLLHQKYPNPYSIKAMSSNLGKHTNFSKSNDTKSMPVWVKGLGAAGVFTALYLWPCDEGGYPASLNEDGTYNPCIGADDALNGDKGVMRRWGKHGVVDHTYHGQMFICAIDQNTYEMLLNADPKQLGVALTAAFAANFPGAAVEKIYDMGNDTTRMFVAAGQDPIESKFSYYKKDGNLYLTLVNETLEGHALTGSVSLTYIISPKGIGISVFGKGEGYLNAGRATWFAGMGRYYGTWTCLCHNEYTSALKGAREVSFTQAYEIIKANPNKSPEDIRAMILPQTDPNSFDNYVMYLREISGLPIRYPQYTLAGLRWFKHDIRKHKKKSKGLTLNYW